MPPRFQPGDRVRITHPHHEYTGCRGTIVDDPALADDGVTVLGHHVAVDGENGLPRPFLATELEPLRAMRAGGRAARAARPRNDAQAGPGEA